MAKSFEGLKSATLIAKQIIAISISVITGTIAFYDKIGGEAPSAAVRVLIAASWIVLVFAVLAGLWTLQGITGALDHLDQIANGERDDPGRAPSVYDSIVRFPALLTNLLFVMALALVVAAGVARFSAPAATAAASHPTRPSNPTR